MTDFHEPPTPDPLDDLASAHLDGQTTEAEAARIAADPSLAERVAGMAAVRAAVWSAGSAVDEDRRDASIAAALDAFDEASDDTGVDEGGTLTPITAAGARRGVSRRTLQLVGAVAVAVLLALFVPLLGRLDSDPSEEDLATSEVQDAAPDANQRDAATGDAAAGALDARAPAASTYALAGSSVELGTFDDVDSLEEAVRLLPAPAMAADQAAGPTTTVGTTAEAAVACTDAPGAVPPDAGSRVLTGTATLDDRAVLVFVYERATGERTVVVVAAADCAVVSSRAL